MFKSKKAEEISELAKIILIVVALAVIILFSWIVYQSFGPIIRGFFRIF